MTDELFKARSMNKWDGIAVAWLVHLQFKDKERRVLFVRP
jgi:hypothetical protein